MNLAYLERLAESILERVAESILERITEGIAQSFERLLAWKSEHVEVENKRWRRLVPTKKVQLRV